MLEGRITSSPHSGGYCINSVPHRPRPEEDLCEFCSLIECYHDLGQTYYSMPMHSMLFYFTSDIIIGTLVDDEESTDYHDQ